MPYSAAIDTSLIRQWLAAKMEPQAIEEELRSGGMDAETIAGYLKAYKKEKNAKRQFLGMMLMGLGAFLGFLSCVISLVNPIPSLYNLFLFGLTSVAILIICAGMYLVFE